jgi:uncharacterized glyoxalase superfamily protein PhnB
MSQDSPLPPVTGCITPHLVCKDAAAAIDFYARAFGAEETMRLPGPDGGLMHAEVRIGGALLMLTEARPEWGARDPHALGGSPVTLHLDVADVDAAFARAVDAGATVTMPVADMFWGDRYGQVQDPFGHHWSMATHIRDVSPEALAAAAAEACCGQLEE